jgi:hypothetical protein
VFASIAALAAGCFGGSNSNPAGAATESTAAAPTTNLRIDTTWTSAAGSTRRQFHLRCNPPSGDVDDPAVACMQIADDSRDFFGEPAGEYDLYGGGGTVVVSGLYHGQQIHLSYRYGEYPQSSEWMAIVNGGSIHAEINRPTVRGS